MTAPEPSGGPSPLRVGGLALVGVAVVSAIIGLTTLATGNGDVEPTAAAPAPPTTSAPPAEVPPPAPVPPTSAAVPPPPPGALPTSDATVPVPPSVPPGGVAAPPAPGAAPGAPAPAAPVAPAPGAPAPGVPGAPGAPGSGGAGAGTADGGPAAGDRAVAARAPLRVYNNSTISGLAARAAEDFRNAGWPVEVVDNYPHGIIPTSTVYFRPGTNEEAPAKELGAEFGMRVSPRFEGLQDASPGLIVIVTNDYRRSAS